MDTRIATSAPAAPSIPPHPVPPVQHPQEHILQFPPRSRHGPTSIGELLHPLQRIIRHPDRNRLLADFFKEQQ